MFYRQGNFTALVYAETLAEFWFWASISTYPIVSLTLVVPVILILGKLLQWFILTVKNMYFIRSLDPSESSYGISLLQLSHPTPWSLLFSVP